MSQRKMINDMPELEETVSSSIGEEKVFVPPKDIRDQEDVLIPEGVTRIALRESNPFVSER